MFWTWRTLNSLLSFVRALNLGWIITQSRKKLRHNCAIQGARLIWKQKIWLAICELLCSLTNQKACFITFFALNYLFSALAVLRKNCTALNQSESSNFFMYIIRLVINNINVKNLRRGAPFIHEWHYCSKSHLLNQWEWDSKTKEPSRLQRLVQSNH